MPDTVSHSIYWGNRDAGGRGEAAQIDAGPGVSVRFSCVEGLGSLFGGNGNIGVEPLFVDPLGADGVLGTLDDDLRLRDLSPCIDAASNSAVPAGVDVDLDGLPRFVDVPSMPDTGEGVAPIADMGCFEHP